MRVGCASGWRGGVGAGATRHHQVGTDGDSSNAFCAALQTIALQADPECTLRAQGRGAMERPAVQPLHAAHYLYSRKKRCELRDLSGDGQGRVWGGVSRLARVSGPTKKNVNSRQQQLSLNQQQPCSDINLSPGARRASRQEALEAAGCAAPALGDTPPAAGWAPLFGCAQGWLALTWAQPTALWASSSTARTRPRSLSQPRQAACGCCMCARSPCGPQGRRLSWRTPRATGPRHPWWRTCRRVRPQGQRCTLFFGGGARSKPAAVAATSPLIVPRFCPIPSQLPPAPAGEVLVGRAAVKRLRKDPQSTFFSVKRLIVRAAHSAALPPLPPLQPPAPPWPPADARAAARRATGPQV